MATSGTATGNGVTIGVSVNNNYIFINWQLASQNASINTSYINWQAYFHYTSSDAQLDDGDVSVNGSLRWDVPGRVKNYAGTFTTRDHPLASEGSFAIVHDTNGSKNFNINGSIGGSLSARSSASANWDLPAFDRTPTTPSITTSTRTTTGTSFSITSWSGSVNNSGPAVTWTLQRADNAAFTVGVIDVSSTTSSGATLTASSLTATTTYYFRIRGTNSVTSTYSSVITSNGVPGPPTGLSVTPVTTATGRFTLAWTAPSNTQGGISRYDIFVNDTFVESTTLTSFTSIKLTSGGTAFTPGTSYNFKIAAKNATNLNETAIANVSSSITSAVAGTAPGTPYAPTAVPNISNVGLDVTVTSAAVSANGGVAINTANANEGYFVQYQLADTLAGTYGYGGTAGAWSPATKMSNQTTRTHTYSLMTPAKYYKFRTYGANTVTKASDNTTNIAYPHNNITYTSGVNFATNATGYFLAAGGKRFDGTNWIPTQTAKRFDGTDWVPLTIAKRFDGTNWVPLS